MEHLTPEGLKVANDLAQRYGFSPDAVIQMMVAVLHGRGGMAQFNHPEFAGSGQWMRGGMLMLGDMFNHALKARVDGLCQAIAAELARQPELFPSGSFQAQSQSGGGGLFAPDPRDTWWPVELGAPSASGSQNNLRYAFFPAAGRLAVEANGQVTVYDTGGNHIAGFSQQQAPGGAVVFTTPGGSVSLASLAPVWRGVQQQAQSSSGGLSQQAQSGGGGSQHQQLVGTGMAPLAGLAPMGGMAPMTFSPMAPVEAWWPRDLGAPASIGGQNDLRYAIFPAARRLAVESHGQVTVHDSGELTLTGCCQSGGEGGLSFTTPMGVVPLASLPVVARHGPGEAEVVAPEPVAPQGDHPAAAPPKAATPITAPVPAPASQGSRQSEVLEALSKLGELKDKGILTEAEFVAKKTELLSRL